MNYRAWMTAVLDDSSYRHGFQAPHLKLGSDSTRPSLVKPGSIKLRACAATLIWFTLGSPLPSQPAESNLNLVILDPSALQMAKDRLQHGDSALRPVLEKLKDDAEPLLAERNFSVVNKQLAPPGGDKHDYMSIAPYWWPNPTTVNGLPYVRRDGETNPERDHVSDRKALENMIAGVETLSFTYFFTGREEYAARAAKLLRVWFMDEDTKMKPHLRFAQAIPGRTPGRAAGIIETHNLPGLIDAVALLSGSPAWSTNEQGALQRWFEAYLHWLLESPAGRTEAKAPNNHGSWYDVQVASFSVFVGKKDLARNVLSEFGKKRIAKQIEPDGRQPHELQRTQSWNYSLFNLEAMFTAASVADKLGVVLWNDQEPDRGGIRKALDWLVPFAIGKKSWTEQQITPWQPQRLAPFLRRAALHYRDLSYERALNAIPGVRTDQRMYLLYFKPLAEITENSRR
ncbi:MAG: alginate lyase family protein [Alphaproteobacteria bacterium]